MLILCYECAMYECAVLILWLWMYGGVNTVVMKYSVWLVLILYCGYECVNTVCLYCGYECINTGVNTYSVPCLYCYEILCAVLIPLLYCGYECVMVLILWLWMYGVNTVYYEWMHGVNTVLIMLLWMYGVNIAVLILWC